MPFLAIGGVELVAILVAVSGLLVSFAGHMWMRYIKGVVGNAPGILAHLSPVIDIFSHPVQQALNSTYDQTAHPAAQGIWAGAMAPWHVAWHTNQAIANAKGWGVQGVQNAAIATNVAAGAYLYADGVTAAAQAAAEAAARGYAGSAQANAERAAQADAAAATANANAYTNTQINTVDTTITGLNNTVVSNYDSLVNQITGVKTDVLSEANRLFGQAETGIRTLQGEVAGIPAEITGAIDQIVPGDIAAALAAAGVAAIPGLLSRVGTLTAEVDGCLKPMCGPGNAWAQKLGHLGSLMQGLEELGLEALFVALAAECFTHPDTVVEDFGSVIHAVGDPMMTALRDVIGH
jgi:hypothetical protein